MTWTYTNDPANVTLDEIRFLIGDTNAADEQLSDEELTYLLGEYSTPQRAAVAAARALASKYAREVDRQVGDLRIRAQSRYEHYKDLAKTLSQQLAISAPVAGIFSGNDQEQRLFRVGQHDVYPGEEKRLGEIT